MEVILTTYDTWEPILQEAICELTPLFSVFQPAGLLVLYLCVLQPPSEIPAKKNGWIFLSKKIQMYTYSIYTVSKTSQHYLIFLQGGALLVTSRLYKWVTWVTCPAEKGVIIYNFTYNWIRGPTCKEVVAWNVTDNTFLGSVGLVYIVLGALNKSTKCR